MRTLFIVVTMVALLSAIGLACGPFFSVAVFSFARHPDLPRTAYADGKLGVVPPGYARSYLVVAYRHMTGVGIDAREREQLLGYWSDRETARWDKIGVDWQQRWAAAVGKLPDAPKSNAKKLTGGALSFDKDTNSFVLNCAGDAFRTALHTLEARTAAFGAGSRAVKDWTAAQLRVFDNCDAEKPSIPAPAASDLPEIVRKDRDYQIAAAHFYSHRYEQAEREFEAIAADLSSPWKTLAPYLVARTIARTSGPGAETRARAILANPALASTHGITYALMRRVLVQQKDEPYFHDLSTLLASKGQGNGLREEMWEFTRLYDSFSGYDLWELPDSKKAVNLAPLERDDLPDWIATYQGLRKDAAKHAYERWKSTKRLPWLTAALLRADARSPQAAELIDAAAAVPQTSPAYLTVAYQRMHLMIDAGHAAEVKPALDALLARGGMPKSAANAFRGLRMQVAPDLADFLRFAHRTPVLMTSTDDIAQSPSYWGDNDARPQAPKPLFDDDAAMVFNQRLPLDAWKQAAESADLPPNARQAVTLAAFTRAAVLGNHDAARALAPASARTYLDGDDRGFAEAFALLHMPEAAPYLRSGAGRTTGAGKIDNYRENWWCAPMEKTDAGLYHAGEMPEDKHVDRAPQVAFLESGAAVQEVKALIAAGGGSKFLGRAALTFAKAHPNDPRVPEALHLAVRANRYACDSASDWETTRDCFRLLHARYPKSEWTKKTPVWNR